jgi:hypothetical protein
MARAIVMAASVLVVLAAVGFGFLRLGRSTVAPTPSASGPASQMSISASPSSAPTYSPTDESGSPEPQLPAGNVVAGEGGRQKGPGGLPLGYQRDEAGAVSAATNYLMWMNSIRIADKRLADDMADSAAADPATRTALVESFDALRSGLESLTADQPEPARGAYAIAEYSARRALIYIWAPEVTTDTAGQTDHLWAIDAIELVWSSGDWKLNKALIAKTGGAAVEPNNPAGNPTAEEKHSILTRTPADPGEIADSAEQSWFEYSNAPR